MQPHTDTAQTAQPSTLSLFSPTELDEMIDADGLEAEAALVAEFDAAFDGMIGAGGDSSLEIGELPATTWLAGPPSEAEAATLKALFATTEDHTPMPHHRGVFHAGN